VGKKILGRYNLVWFYVGHYYIPLLYNDAKQIRGLKETNEFVNIESSIESDRIE